MMLIMLMLGGTAAASFAAHTAGINTYLAELNELATEENDNLPTCLHISNLKMKDTRKGRR